MEVEKKSLSTRMHPSYRFSILQKLLLCYRTVLNWYVFAMRHNNKKKSWRLCSSRKKIIFFFWKEEIFWNAMNNIRSITYHMHHGWNIHISLFCRKDSRLLTSNYGFFFFFFSFHFALDLISMNFIWDE